MAGERGHTKVGQHFSGTNVLVLAPGDKHNTVQGRRKVEKWAWTVGGGSGPPKTAEALLPIFRKVWKNRPCMITNLHRKQETYI